MNAYEHAKEQRIVPRYPLGPNMTEMMGTQAVDRAVHNSLPPMDDVGEDVTYMRDQVDFHHSDVEQLLEEREKTHGIFELNAQYGQALRELFRQAPGWQKASVREREALDYLAGKLSRILSGRPDIQHWDDIAGYAKLAAHPGLQSA